MDQLGRCGLEIHLEADAGHIGGVGSTSRRFDSSYSANVYGSIGMTADFFRGLPYLL